MSSLSAGLVKKPLDDGPRELQNPAQSPKGDERGDREIKPFASEHSLKGALFQVWLIFLVFFITLNHLSFIWRRSSLVEMYPVVL